MRGSDQGELSMDQKDLSRPDFMGNAAGALGAAAMAQSAKRAPKWVRRFLYVCIGVTVLAVGAGMIDKIVNIGSLPKCDAQRTRDTLSNLNKQNQLNASAYNFIRQNSATEDEVTCTAGLALRAGGNVEYDYRIFKQDGGIKVQITAWRR
jgi:hypothetical protein